jgi:hypothetical protein
VRLFDHWDLPTYFTNSNFVAKGWERIARAYLTAVMSCSAKVSASLSLTLASLIARSGTADLALSINRADSIDFKSMPLKALIAWITRGSGMD